MSHPTVRVRYPDWHLTWMRQWVGPDFGNPIYRHVRLDVGIAPLVKALWSQRIPTFSSCQGSDRGRAFIDVGPGYANAIAQVGHHHGIRVEALEFDGRSPGHLAIPRGDVPALAAAIHQTGRIDPLTHSAARAADLYRALDRIGAL